MIVWLLRAFDRLPSAVRRGVVAVAVLVVVSAAAVGVIVTPPAGHRGAGPQTPSPGRRAVAANRVTVAPPSVVPDATARLRAAASRFLAAYLAVVYGRAHATRVAVIAPGLRTRLARERVLITPAARHRRPSVVSLQVATTTPGFAVATAVVDDGGLAPYVVRVALEHRRGVWLASDVVGG